MIDLAHWVARLKGIQSNVCSYVSRAANLRTALKGLVVMSSDLEKMFTSMVNNQVPELWSKVGWLSTKTLASWVKDLDRRLKFMRDWMTTGTPKSFWLPGFFFPQGFMTGALQSHARRYRLPIDTLNFGFKILPIDNAEDVHEAPADGLYIDGLYVYIFLLIPRRPIISYVASQVLGSGKVGPEA